MKTITVAMWDPIEPFEGKTIQEKTELLEKKFIETYEGIYQKQTARNTFIFVLPEYAFLNYTAHPFKVKPYTKDEFLLLRKTLDILSKNYPQAIICPGSGYVEKQFKHNPEKLKKYIKDSLNYNKDENLTPNIHSSTKQITPSPIKNTTYLFAGGHSKSYTKKENAEFFSFQKSRLKEWGLIFFSGHKSNCMTLNGLRIGIEICIDHKEKILAQEQKISGQTLDIHLLIGNVIDINPANIANNKRNIVVINCAGFFSCNPDAIIHTGIWVGNEQGKLTRLVKDDSSNQDLYLFSNIELPNQPENQLRSKL